MSNTSKIFSVLKEKNALDIFASTFITKAIAFLGSIALIQLLSKQDYGLLGSLENIYAYIQLLAGLGLNNAALRWLVLKDSPAVRKGIFANTLVFGTTFNIMLVAITVIAFYLFPIEAAFDNIIWMLPIMLVAILFQYVYETGVFSLRALLKNRTFAILSIVSAFLVWGSKIFLTVIFGLEGAIFSWPAAYAIIATIVLLIFFCGIFKGIKSLPVSKIELRSMLFYSIQYMVANGLWSLFLQNNILMIGWLTNSPEYIADYKAANVFPTILALLSSSIGMFVFPYFVKHEKDPNWIWKNYKRVLLGNIGVVAIATFFFGLLAEPLILFLYGERYKNITFLTILLLTGGFLNSGLRYISAHLIAAVGKIQINTIVAASGILAQIILNLLLIPLLGVYGVALTEIAVQLGMATATTISFIKIYRNT